MGPIGEYELSFRGWHITMERVRGRLLIICHPVSKLSKSKNTLCKHEIMYQTQTKTQEQTNGEDLTPTLELMMDLVDKLQSQGCLIATIKLE